MATNKEQRQSFVFHRDWFDVISKRNDATRLEVYDAIMEKVFNNTSAQLSDLASVVMDFVLPQIDRDTQKWIDTREKRCRAGAKHRGNQYVGRLEQNGTNGTNVPTLEQNGTNGTVSVSDSVSVSVDNISKDNVIIKEKEKEDKSSFKKKNFVKPLVADVDAYVKEKGYHIDAEMFFNFYESKGWMIGKNKMQNWRKAVVTWERKWKAENTRASNEGLFNQETNNPYPKGYWQ